jgi:hypothetical protein
MERQVHLAADGVDVSQLGPLGEQGRVIGARLAGTGTGELSALTWPIAHRNEPIFVSSLVSVTV